MEADQNDVLILGEAGQKRRPKKGGSGAGMEKKKGKGAGGG